MRKSIKRAAKLSSSVANVPAIIENEAVTEHSVMPVLASDVHTDGAIVLDNETGSDVIPAEIIADETTADETGETITATEAKPDPRAERATRIAADRAAVRELYANFEANRASVPVKPLSAFKLATSTAHPNTRGVSQRQCAALAVAFAAAGIKLAAGAVAPRVFEIDGKPSAIENGVLRDAISSGLCTVSGETPDSECITLGANAAKSISAQLGASLLKAANLI